MCRSDLPVPAIALALLDRPVVGPPKMRCRAAHRTPRLGERRHLLCGGARLQPKSDFHRFLHREIARRPGIAMAEAEQQIDVGGPRADAVQRGQRVVRGVGVLVRQHVEIEPLGGDLAGEILHGLDLRRRQAEPAEPARARLAQAVMVERIERSADSGPDCRSTRGRQLLAADDVGQSGKARLAPPQRRHARDLEHRFEPRVLLDQRVDGRFEVGLGVEVEGH